MFDTPILFLIFNRPDVTQIVFNQIKKIQPKYLYIAADGPRPNRAGENVLCEEARVIIKQIDWDCNLKTLFRKQNLGCGKAVSEAITWFFDNVEQGIILEDDCLPELSFFPFCEELLNRYHDDDRIGMISGNNYKITAFENCHYSYFFSKYVSIWGWATWKRAWQHYNYNIDLYSSDFEFITEIMKNTFSGRELDYRLNILKKTANGEIDTWDHQWMFCNLIQNMLTLIPTTNLISNKGFGENATHTTHLNSINSNLQTKNIVFPLSHPTFLLRSEQYENTLCNDLRKNQEHNKFLRLKNKLKQILLQKKSI